MIQLRAQGKPALPLPIRRHLARLKPAPASDDSSWQGNPRQEALDEIMGGKPRHFSNNPPAEN
jgi:hypothetical protein